MLVYLRELFTYLTFNFINNRFKNENGPRKYQEFLILVRVNFHCLKKFSPYKYPSIFI